MMKAKSAFLATNVVVLATFLFAGSALAQGFFITTGTNLRDISGTGTEIFLSDDEVSSAVPIGFGFSFYGVNYTQVYISSNGFMAFENPVSSGCCSGEPIPTPPLAKGDENNEDINNFVAGLWTDLCPASANTASGKGGSGCAGQIFYQTLGSAPNREFVVGFYDVAYCCTSPPAVTFEMILREADFSIELQLFDVPVESSDRKADADVSPQGGGGSNSSVGVENQSGTQGVQVAFGPSTSTSFSGAGFIIFPSGTPGAVAIPTLGVSGLALMVFVLAVFGAICSRRRMSRDNMP